MRILFLHRDFPGPFRFLAQAFGALPDTRTLFLSERGRRNERLPGVRRLRIAVTEAPCAQDSCENEIALMLRRGARAANAMLRLRKDGFAPDIVCGASSDGHSFYARDIFPDALYVCRADWFYTHGENHTFFAQGPRPPSDFALPRVRNLCQYNALSGCDMALTSTHWQKKQYPPLLAQRMKVEPDGVDSHYFSPAFGSRFLGENCDLTGVKELVTFSFRGSPSSRGLPQFLEALPSLLAKRPHCHVLIMASPPSDGDSAPQMEDLEQYLPLAMLASPTRHRIHMRNFSSLDEYRRLLRASTVHVYMSAPFMLSAGLFEAMSCACLVAGSDTAPVQEVIQHGSNGFLFDFWDSANLANTLAAILERAPRLMPLREAARQTVLEHYDLATQTAKQCDCIVDAWKNKKN